MSDIAILPAEEQVARLYNGEVTLIFEPKPHRYYIEEDGERFLVPGVTSILTVYAKDGLPWWAANVAIGLLIDKLSFATEADRTVVSELYRAMISEKRKDKREKLRKTLGTVITLTTDTTELACLLYEARCRHNEIKYEAADVGKQAHDWLEGYIKALIAGTIYLQPKPDDPRVVSCIDAALDWMKRHHFKPYYSERKVFSRTYVFMGTTDWVGEVTSCGDPTCCQHTGTHVELGDFKSCNDIHDENFMQTAAYLWALLEELTELEVHGRRVLKLGKEDGAFDSRTRSAAQFEGDFLAFLGLMQAYLWKEQDKVNKAQDREEQRAAKAEAKRLAAAEAPITKPTRVRLKKQEYEPIPIAG